MHRNKQYPIICTDRLIETVNYYEDHFDFVPEVQMDNFFLLHHAEDKERYLAFIDVENDILPKEAQKISSGIILSFMVNNVDAAYQQAYWEGLNILNEPTRAECGQKHFMIRDPNGVHIYMVQKDQIDSRYLVAA